MSILKLFLTSCNLLECQNSCSMNKTLENNRRRTVREIDDEAFRDDTNVQRQYRTTDRQPRKRSQCKIQSKVSTKCVSSSHHRKEKSRILNHRKSKSSCTAFEPKSSSVTEKIPPMIYPLSLLNSITGFLNHCRAFNPSGNGST